MKNANDDDVLTQLVHQFSDQFAFHRELIQNSIDAGSRRIEVRLSFQPAAKGARGVATSTVEDWGEGMNREVIERYLLTAFRSSKEEDLTKIGKFGIGFLSIFSLAPELVIVDTGRDGEDWHILFHPDFRYELLRSPDPVEGTRVQLLKEMTAEEYASHVESSLAAVKRWCRHSEAEVTFTAGPPDGGPLPPAAPIREPFVVDAPIQVTYQEEGTEIVAGPARVSPPPCGFYNRGLTLLETAEELVPGVTFKIVSRYLEHTLTRDNVVRDKGFAKALELVRRLVKRGLAEKLRQELPAAAVAPERFDDYGVMLRYATTALKPNELVFALAGGGHVDAKTLRTAVDQHFAFYATPGDPLVAPLAAAGLVLLCHSGDVPAAVTAVCSTAGLSKVEEEFSLSVAVGEAGAGAEALPQPGAEGLCRALHELFRGVGVELQSVVLAKLHGAGAQSGVVLATTLGQPERAEVAFASPFKLDSARTLCLEADWAIVKSAVELAARAPALAATLCFRIIAIKHQALDEGMDQRLTETALRMCLA